ncbi:primosomal protein N' [Patescibacteria group bacterium]|nr:MAG: primosomal protein N' [Patescibacteria group bacterium]
MPENKGKFIVDVVPLTRISLIRQQHFSYVWDAEIPVGILVSAPLFRRNVEGIVIGNRQDFERFGNIQLRRINSITQESALTPNQLKLAEYISEYYICPLGIVLKFFIPKKVKERQKIQVPKPNQGPKKIQLTREQTNAVDAITNNAKNSKLKSTSFLLFGPASSGKTEVYIQAIAKLLKRNSKQQFLILLPELTLTPQAVERYGHLVKPEELVVLHSHVSKGQLYTAWQKIKSGEAKIIIGTRMAIFAPFQNLQLIVIDEEQDISFKQWDMTPRYDVHEVATELARLYEATLALGSATPRVETFYQTSLKKIGLLELPRLVLPNQSLPNTNMLMVDMRKERWKKTSALNSVLSGTLKAEVAFALKHRRQIVLFVNRRGMSAFAVCAKCKNVLRCPKCDRSLIYDTDGTYKCIHCTYRSDVFVTCAKCGNTAFKNIGLGTQKIERELQGLFASARIQRADFDSTRQIGAHEKIYQEFSQGKIDIIIGTQMVTKGWDLPSVALVGIIDADSLLSIPDFRTDESAFQHIVQVAGRTSRLGSQFGGTVVIQTYQPEHFVMKAAVAMDYQAFYVNELRLREILHYPPFNRIIKLVYQDQSEKKVEREAVGVYKLLTEQLSASAGAIISLPHNPLVAKIRGRVRKQIVLKITATTVPAEIHSTIKRLGTGWIVDVDPIGIA